jgi:hypothetical protein
MWSNVSRDQEIREMIEELYTSGEYLKKNPTWHVGESPWKAREIMRMMGAHFNEYRDNYGHVHYFTKETALRMLDDVGWLSGTRLLLHD